MDSPAGSSHTCSRSQWWRSGTCSAGQATQAFGGRATPGREADSRGVQGRRRAAWRPPLKLLTARSATAPHAFTVSPLDPQIQVLSRRTGWSRAAPHSPLAKCRMLSAHAHGPWELLSGQPGPRKQRDESVLPKRTVCPKTQVCAPHRRTRTTAGPHRVFAWTTGPVAQPTRDARGPGPHMVPQTHVLHKHHNHHQGRLGHTPTQQGHDTPAHCDTGLHCRPTHAQPALQPRLSRRGGRSRCGGAEPTRWAEPPSPGPAPAAACHVPCPPHHARLLGMELLSSNHCVPALLCDKCTPDLQARGSASRTCND